MNISLIEHGLHLLLSCVGWVASFRKAVKLLGGLAIRKSAINEALNLTPARTFSSGFFIPECF